MMFDFGIWRVAQLWDGAWEVELLFVCEGRVWTTCIITPA